MIKKHISRKGKERKVLGTDGPSNVSNTPEVFLPE
jgi:hypothetical protein